MAEILVKEGEPLEKAAKRFERTVAREGTLAVLRRHSYYSTPSQKRRAKSKLAQKRLRRFLRRNKPTEMPDDKREGWIYGRIDIESGWPIDLKATPPKQITEDIHAKLREAPTPAEEPTEYSSCIFEYPDESGVPLIVLVLNDPTKEDNKNIKKITGNPRLGFPGGGVKPGETPEKAGPRETEEETGLIVEIIEKVYTETVDDHTKHFYAAKIVGGSPKKGVEILRIEGQPIEALTELASMGYLRPSHRRAYEAWFERREAR